MINEIDLGALIINLKKETHDISPYLIYKNKADFLIDRPFEENRKWNSIEQTSYIESLYLGCFSGIIVRFKNNNHTIICDGLNRYNTIEKYCENKLALNPKGLKHLKFLGNQKIGEDNELTKEIFKKTTSIKIIDYSYKETENKKVLTPEDWKLLNIYM